MLSQELVGQFVLAAHSDLGKVRTMLAEHPDLLNAKFERFDEDALQAAGHMGAREVAEYLLEQGAPLTVYAAAMLGREADVRGMLERCPELARSPGIHGISLLYHAALSGNVCLAEAIVNSGGGDDLNKPLQAAAKFGHVGMLEWLLERGATDINLPDIYNLTPLALAQKGGHTAAAELLRSRGGLVL